MADKVKKVSRTSLRAKKKLIEKKLVIGVGIFVLLILLCAVLQSSGLRVFGSVPQLCFALVCSLGFIYGEKAGAVAGIFAGFIVDCLGSADFSLSPLLYMLCGYLCGIMTDWFLSRNFPSFMVYMCIMGALHEGVILLYFGLFSQSFSLWEVLIRTALPEFFAIIVVSPVTYGVTRLVRRWV